MTIIEQKSIPEPNSGCWIWMAGRTGAGYGQIRIDKKLVYAHRLSHTIYKGDIPSKYDIDHLCRNKSCVNPDHLEAVPHALNNQRAFPNHCIHGHPLTPDNLCKLTNRSKYQRRCKTCHRERMARRRAKKH